MSLGQFGLCLRSVRAKLTHQHQYVSQCLHTSIRIFFILFRGMAAPWQISLKHGFLFFNFTFVLTTLLLYSMYLKLPLKTSVSTVRMCQNQMLSEFTVSNDSMLRGVKEVRLRYFTCWRDCGVLCRWQQGRRTQPIWGKVPFTQSRREKCYTVYNSANTQRKIHKSLHST